MNELKQIQAHTLRVGIDHSKFLVVKLLEIPNISYAHKVFDFIPKPTVFLYNKLIQAYSCHGPPQQCLSLYTQMRVRCCTPNPHSFTFLFAACASLLSSNQGRKLHTHFLKLGLESDPFALTALVDMYSKCGFLSWARRVFDEMEEKDVPIWNSMIAGYTRSGELVGAKRLFDSMPSRNVVSWTSMISGYSQNGRYQDALEMFVKMEEEEGVRPNEVTISSVLPACANLGALEIGVRIEAYARERGFLRNLFVSNALLEMYAKCGEINMAKRIFSEIGGRRNLCSWNSMIMGLAVHGRWHDGLELYREMLMRGTTPDDITFVGVLLACTHGGLVEQGRKLFESMQKDFSITPKLEHYGCMVDLLGRAGKLNEVYDTINRMPVKPDSVIWGALLGACSYHGNIELAEKAVDALLVLDPRNPGNLVILSNIYAVAGRWDGVAKIRKLMKGNNITKQAGYSFIEVDGRMHKFIVEDRSHPSSDAIYSVLNEVSIKMKLLRDETDLDSEIEKHCLMI